MKLQVLRSWMLLLFAALIASACSPGTPTPISTPDLPPSTATAGSTPTAAFTPTPSISVNPAALRGITIQVWHAFSGSAEGVFTSQVTQFNATNEWGISVNPTSVGDYPNLFEAVNTAIESGEVPDLVAALPEQTLAWDASTAVVDLTTYINDSKWGMETAGISGIPSVFWAQDAIGGRQLGVPAQRSARFLFYNQTWAHELGFNNPPTTAEAFRQQACAANASFRADASPQNDGYGGWIVDNDWQTDYAWLLAFGGGVADKGAYAFQTDPNLAALQFLKGLFDDHCAWLSTEATPFDSFAHRSALFVSGDLAEVPAAQEAMSRLNNSDEWTLIPYPGDSGSVVVAYGPSYSVLKSTPERQLAAWLFARWLLSPQNQAHWVDATGLFPIGPNDITVAPSSQWQAAVANISLAQDAPQLASWRQVRYMLQDGINLIFQTSIPLDQIPALLTEVDSMAKEISSK